ncbi:MAG: plasmid pRiA4b ORF-3 family protein [Holosporaceae bacterium]|jgi:hypothetical protein|nr:plasmid pRiA4b ORF-3 family protein [Holosporaceae bacterium]
MKEIKNIYVIKITLRDSEPEIWRRVEVPYDFTFRGLHQVIQLVMPWSESHLHSFAVKAKHGAETLISTPYPEDDWESEDENKVLLHQYLPDAKHVIYEYDFGDSWEHEIKLEKIIESEDKVSYPRCTGGEMACPPEDCGGLYGYYGMLETVNGPDCEEKKEVLDWLGKRFDPKKFDSQKIKFPKALLCTYAKK